MPLEIECKYKDCWWQSGYESKHNECYHCSNNTKADSDKKDKYISVVDKINELYEYLMGISMPDGVHCRQPKLSSSKSFSIIWFLQEITCCLPDTIEQCRGCHNLFDSDKEGCYLDKEYRHKSNGRRIGKKYWGHWCDACMPGNLEIY